MWDDVVLGDFFKKRNIQPLRIEQYSFTNNYIPEGDEINHALQYGSIRVRNNENRELYDVGIWNKLCKQYEISNFTI
jgi:hypothetical protein